jgi:hypothetical protein
MRNSSKTRILQWYYELVCGIAAFSAYAFHFSRIKDCRRRMFLAVANEFHGVSNQILAERTQGTLHQDHVKFALPYMNALSHSLEVLYQTLERELPATRVLSAGWKQRYEVYSSVYHSLRVRLLVTRHKNSHGKKVMPSLLERFVSSQAATATIPQPFASRLISLFSTICPIHKREAVFGDLWEDVANLREKGLSEMKISIYIIWQIGVIAVMPLLNVVAAALTIWESIKVTIIGR